MPEKNTAPSRPLPKRSWWRRIVRGLGWTFLALLVLHWPLIIFGGPVIARVLARKQHIDVRFQLSGTIWTNLTVNGLQAFAAGDGPTPVETITIDQLRFHYSLWRLATKGLGEFLYSYEVHHADLSFVALPSKSEQEHEEKKSVIETLRTVLAQPAAYSDRVLIDDFSIRVHSPESETMVQHLNALFDPKVTGYFRIARLQIPGLPVWENLDAVTTYAHRNLIQRGMRLGPNIVIDELNYDASHRAEGRGLVSLKSHGFGGELNIVLTGQEKQEKGKHLAKAYDTHLQVNIAGVRVHEAAAYFGVKNVPVERLSAFALDFTGDPEKPRTWGGSVHTLIENLGAGTFTIPRFEMASQFAGGTANTSAGVRVGDNTVQLESKILLPEMVDDWFSSGVDATAHVDITDLPALAAAFMPNAKASGQIGLDAVIGLHERKVAVSTKFNLRDVTFDTFVATHADGDIQASTVLRPDNSIQPMDIDAKANVAVATMAVNSFTLDSGRIQLDVVKGNASLRELSVKRGDNYVSAQGLAQLPPDLSKIIESRGELQATIHAPALDTFGLTVSGKTIGGALDLQARAQFADSRVDGGVDVNGAVGLGDFRTQKVAARVRLRGESVQVEDLLIGINDHDRITATARLGTVDPKPYEGELKLAIRDLAVLQPLLAAFGVTDPVKGELGVTWNGKGTLAPAKHEGKAAVALTAAKYGNVAIDQLGLAGTYTATSANAELHATAGPTVLKTEIVWADDKVSLRDINVHQAGEQVLTGQITYGVAKPAEGAFDPLRQPFTASLDASKLDIEKLLASVKQEAPATGLVSMHLAAQGTPARPEMELTASGHGIKAKAAPQFDAAEFNLALNYRPGNLSLDASARQALIKPVEIKARVPLDVEKTLQDKKLDPNLPLDVSVRVPQSSLAVLPKLTDQVRRVSGTVEVDVKATGTVEKPVLAGAATIAIQDARLTNENVPAIGNFDARLVFNEQNLRFERFRGVIGGGSFDLGGNVGLANLNEPTFDLRLKADKVLAKRDDAITVRTDADVTVKGALHGSTVAGTVYVTQSRFFKEIDILPIALPGKTKPAPKTAPTDVNISLPPPLDTWKFDVAIKTHENDPFLVRGNLANGRVALDLNLGGEGKQPYLEGTVTIEQFTGSLPFSTITVENGHVYFTREQPFQPTLDIQAQSKTRDYTVTAYIYGNAREPQLQLSSEPPLSHADIVSLLATGTTTTELSGNADLLASRAAIYAVESLYKKVFKKKGSAPPKEAAPRNDANFMDRFNLELGGLDQKTGAREANARFKINDQTYIIGEFDTRGQYTGSLKYLLRFR